MESVNEELLTSIGKMLDDRLEQLGDRLEMVENELKKFKRITESRFGNFEFARTLPPSHFTTGSHSPYVEQGKPGHAIYESDDTIVPLPRYFR